VTVETSQWCCGSSILIILSSLCAEDIVSIVVSQDLLPIFGAYPSASPGRMHQCGSELNTSTISRRSCLNQCNRSSMLCLASFRWPSLVSQTPSNLPPCTTLCSAFTSEAGFLLLRGGGGGGGGGVFPATVDHAGEPGLHDCRGWARALSNFCHPLAAATVFTSLNRRQEGTRR
jgi:hypothetical protein